MDPSSSAPSLSERIAEARERAEGFSARHAPQPQPSESVRLIERERERWTKLYHEKAVIIEQLERELGSTVDALSRREGAASLSFSVASDRSVSNSIDVLNFSEALRRENSSVKASYSQVVDEKARVEADRARAEEQARALRLDNAALRQELQDLADKHERAQRRWEEERAELSRAVASLQAERSAGAEQVRDWSLGAGPAERRSVSEDRPSAEERSFAGESVLSFAREEITWLRELLECPPPPPCVQ